MQEKNMKNKIKRLFCNLIELKQKKVPLCRAITESSQELGLSPESARNFYYKSLSLLRKNPIMARDLGIDLKLFSKKKFDIFMPYEVDNLQVKIDEGRKQGKSIRQCCMELANNDAKLMLRFQNKYRNLKKKEPFIETIKQQPFLKRSDNKIINIKNAKNRLNKKISDKEINALFLGLVRIIKKSAEESVSSELKSECEFATMNFRQTLIDLNKKETELKKMHELNFDLNLKLENQKKQICLLLDKLSKKKILRLEQKSKEKYGKLKNFKKETTDNIL